MSEESILILNMLREGKISAEQADSLLRAVRTTGPPPPPPPAAPSPPPAAPPPPSVSSTDAATLAAMQAKLAELQSKLGDVQGKLGAAQAARAAGQAVSFAGKMLGHLPHPDVDMSKINKAMDEAMRGLNSIKNDAVRNARVAARQAAHEARRAAKSGGKAFGDMGFTITFGSDDNGAKRPGNATRQPEATETMDSVVTWAGADKLSLHNPHGSLTVIGEDRTDGAASATITKKAWTDTHEAARVLLQQVFLTSTTENGACKVAIVAPADAKNHLLVDVVIRVPRAVPLAAETVWGNVELEGVSSHCKVQTTSGDIRAKSPFDAGAGEAYFEARSGTLTLQHWNVPAQPLSLETTSGNMELENVTVQAITVSSRAGDILAQKVQTVGAADLDSVSGDVRVQNCAFGARVSLKTQSGDVFANAVVCETLAAETVSGDANLRGVTGTMTVKTVSGDAHGEENTGAVSASTVSGDVQWRVPSAFTGSLAATTVSGDILLSLPTDVSARLELNTASGDLSCDQPLGDGAVTTERHITGTLGAGVGSIKLQTASGDAHVTPA